MKSNKQEFYKMKRSDGEVFEIKWNLVESKKNQGYELVDDEPIIHDINTSTKAASTEEIKEEYEAKKDESEDDENVEDLSYNELQSFVSDRTEDYKVIGKSTEELAQKAKELVD